MEEGTRGLRWGVGAGEEGTGGLRLGVWAGDEEIRGLKVESSLGPGKGSGKAACEENPLGPGFSISEYSSPT